MKAHPLSLREKIIADYESGVTYAQLFERYGVSSSAVRKYLKLLRETGTLEVRPHGGGHPRALSPEQVRLLGQLREDYPAATLPELATKLEAEIGIHLSSMSISRYLKQLGYSRKRVATSKKPRTPAKTSSARYRIALCPPDLPHRKAYPSDLTDAEWDILSPLIPQAKGGGRRGLHSKREIVNAMLYSLRSGCQWRMIPHDFPPWQTVYNYFLEWRDSGLWEQINTTLRERLRRTSGRESTPSAAIIDSQSVKTTEKGGSADMTEQNV